MRSGFVWLATSAIDFSNLARATKGAHDAQGLAEFDWCFRGPLLGVAVATSLVDPPWLAATAQAADYEDIIRALKPRQTRSLAKKDPSVDARVKELKQIGKTRGLNHQQRQELSGITQDNPQTDLVIYFAFDSAEISEQAVPQLNELGKALTLGLKDQSFTLAGHSDAKGTAEYNLDLSKRRAEAVQRYLVERFKINPDTLLAVGYGFEQLKDTEIPLSDENRRVQIITLTQ